jgi:hypothetical protein
MGYSFGGGWHELGPREVSPLLGCSALVFVRGGPVCFYKSRKYP